MSVLLELRFINSFKFCGVACICLLGGKYMNPFKFREINFVFYNRLVNGLEI